MTVLIQGSTGQRYEIQLGENLLTDTAAASIIRLNRKSPQRQIFGLGQRRGATGQLSNR